MQSELQAYTLLPLSSSSISNEIGVRGDYTSHGSTCCRAQVEQERLETESLSVSTTPATAAVAATQAAAVAAANLVASSEKGQ